ncbi:MAG: hypothetical protein KGI51_07120 [Rhodospirillales bacterium]|nr:hypothetical protein [Rhodospirillales bacterium]
MISRTDVMLLGFAAGLGGGLVGGVLLGIGIALILNGAMGGWIALLAGVPLSALPGFGLAWRLAARIPD